MTKTNQKLKKKIAEYVGDELKCWNCLNGKACKSGDGNCIKGGVGVVRLEDVLIALDEAVDGTVILQVYRYSGDAKWIIDAETGDDIEWKPNQPLENQSEETINFLSEILCD